MFLARGRGLALSLDGPRQLASVEAGDLEQSGEDRAIRCRGFHWSSLVEPARREHLGVLEPASIGDVLEQRAEV